MIQKQPSLRSLFNRFYSSLTGNQQRQYAKMVVYSLANILLDLFGLALLFATAVSVLDAQFLTKLPFLQNFIFGLGWNPKAASLLLLGLLVVLFIFKSMLAIFIGKRQLQFSFNIASNAAIQRFKQFLNAKIQQHKEVKSAESINQITAITDHMASYLITSSIIFFSETSFLTLALFILAIFNIKLLLFALLLFLPPVLILLLSHRHKIVEYGNRMNELRPKLYESVSNAVFGFTDIKLLAKEAEFLQQFSEVQAQMIKDRTKLQVLTSIIPPRMLEIAAILGLFVISLYAYLFNDNQNIATILALVASMAFRILPSVNRIVQAVQSFKASSFVLNYLDYDKTEVDFEKAAPLSFESSMVVNNLGFRHEPEIPLLEGLDLVINAGDFVGIGGPSGSGKSTLMNCLAGFYEAQKGEVIIEKQTIKDVMRSWQRIISYVEQDAFVLAGTLAENLAFGSKKLNAEEAWKALDQVSLKRWVESLPDGLQTVVGEHGSKISSGQQQRLVLARALYGKAKVFFFDEATNALDDQTKFEVMDSLVKMNESGITIVIVAHDRDVMKYCKQVYELKKGKLYAKGS
jgi:ABC-type bacteriocin/lantibiotic exporter with double-glycine peptidase domain